MSTSRNKLGMTLIEIMIALGVFSVGILGVLNLIISTIKISDGLNLRTTALMLAKQNMEILYHKRNSNLLKYQVRDCLIDGDNSNACKMSLSDIVSKTGQNIVIIPTFDYFNGYKFYIKKIGSNFKKQREDTRFSFSNELVGEKNIKKRLFLYKYCDNNSFSGNKNCGNKSFFGSFLIVNKVKNLPRSDLLSGNIYKIVSKTLYMKGGLTGEINLESFISNLDKE